MTGLKDITGRKFGKLTVLRRLENDKHSNASWLCVCECGVERSAIGAALRAGTSRSCGCDRVKRDFSFGYYDRKLAANGKLRKSVRKYDPVSIAKRFWSFVDKNGPVVNSDLGPCWLWTGSRSPNGYPKFCFMGSSWYAHRVVWFLEHGELPKYACHKCDNGHLGCVNPGHLFNGTAKDNGQDMALKNRSTRGRYKLPEDTELEIASLRRGGWKLQALADKYSVEISTIHRIVKRRK